MRTIFAILLSVVFLQTSFSQDTIVRIDTVKVQPFIPYPPHIGYIHICHFTDYLNEDSRYRFPAFHGSLLPEVQQCYPTIGKSLYSRNTPKFNRELNIFPVIDVLASHSFQDQASSFRGALGFGVNFQINDKWQSRAMFAAGAQLQNNKIDFFNSILNNNFYSSSDTSTAAIFQPRFRMSYKPASFFEIQTGIDQHFIGEGNRSLLLSDLAAPQPFIRLRTRFWKIEFSNLYQLLRENTLGNPVNKFAATHTLDFHITDRFKLGLFESVVFAPKDTLMNRGFEIEYLNPFLFYRPTEYSIGSQDRLLIGLNTSYQFNNVMLYGQLVIDDFVLDELLNRTRWWASKYGGQFGIKSKVRIKERELRWLTELNFARPFLYTHLDEGTVYGNQGLPLAHPLGANFVESFTEARYFLSDKMSVGLTAMIAQQGGQNSNDSTTFGDDIYRPYTERPFEYGYRIGGDGKMNRLRFTFEFNYQLIENWRLNTFIKPGLEIRNTSTSPSITLPFVFVGIRTQLWNERSFTY